MIGEILFQMGEIPVLPGQKGHVRVRDAVGVEMLDVAQQFTEQVLPGGIDVGLDSKVQRGLLPRGARQIRRSKALGSKGHGRREGNALGGRLFNRGVVKVRARKELIDRGQHLRRGTVVVMQGRNWNFT